MKLCPFILAAKIVPNIWRNYFLPKQDQNGRLRRFLCIRIIVIQCREEYDMSVKGELKEAAGFVKEEMNEHGKSPESQKKAQEGRDLRNEGRVEDGKAPKTTKPGTGH